MDITISVGLFVVIFLVLLVVRNLIVSSKAKRKALEILNRGGVESLINTLKDKDAYLRQAAVEALGKTKDPRAVNPLIAILNDEEDGEILLKASESLAEIGDLKAVSGLISLLNHKDLDRQWYASYTLEKLERKGIKDFQAVRPLLLVLKDSKKMKMIKKSEFPYNAVEEALKVITGQNFGQDIGKWEKWCEENIK